MRKILVLLATAAAVLLSVVFAGSPSAQAASLNCASEYTDAHFSSVNVPAGSECVLVDSTVTGGVSVGPDSAFYSCGTAIGGSLSANQSYVNVDFESSIGGSVTISKPGSGPASGNLKSCVIVVLTVQLNIDAYSTVLCAGHVGGSVNLSGATNPSLDNEIGCGPTMHIGAPVMIANNNASVEMDDAVVNGSVICANDNPPAEVANVTAQSIHGCDII